MDGKVIPQKKERTGISKPNIIYFAPCGLSEGVSGSARLKNMLNALGQLEANIKLISYLQGDKFRVRHKQISSRLDAISVYVPRFAPRFLKAFALLPIFIYGLKYIKNSDFIFAHSPSAATGFPGLILSKIFNKPLIIDHMDVKASDTPAFIYNSVIKNSAAVLAISRYLEEEAKEKGCRNVIYVPVFIDTNIFQKDVRQRLRVRKKLEIGDNEIVIGYAGSFSHVQGVPHLLKAFKNLSNRHENIKLVLIGSGNVAKSDDVSQLITKLGLEGKAILVPPQPYESVPKFLSAFDIVCSVQIDCVQARAANPIKIYEYMSMGLPTVVSAIGEILNVIQDGINGFLVKPGDEDDLERVLDWVIQNQDSAKEVGEKAREKIIGDYDIKAMSRVIMQALEIVASKNRSK